MVERFEKFTFAISEISRNWHKLASDEMAKYGLRSTHAVYLITMYNFKDGITAPKLCELCGKDKSDVSRMMSIMESKGLVRKEGNGPNLYRGVLKLTDDGMRAAEQVRERARLAVEIAGNGLTEEKRNDFYQSLDVITNNLRQLSKNGIPLDSDH